MKLRPVQVLPARKPERRTADVIYHVFRNELCVANSTDVPRDALSGVVTAPADKTPRKRVTPKDTYSKLLPAVFHRDSPENPAWIVTLRTAEGKRTHKTLGLVAEMTEFEACRLGQEILDAQRDGRDPFVGELTVAEYFDKVRTPVILANKRSAKDEIGVFNRYVRQKIGQLRMRQVRARHIQGLIDDYISGNEPTVRRQQLAKGTVYQIIATILALFNWSYRRGDLPENPARRIRQIKVENARQVRYSEGELAAIGAQLQFAPPRVRLLFTMLLTSGRRIGELLNARHEDMNLEARTLLIRHTKRGGAFLMPCSPEFLASYEELKKYAIPGNPFLFPSKQGNGPMSAPYRQFNTVLAAAGIKERRTFHDVRRTVGSEASQLPGIGLLDVARSLDHADVSVTTRHYIVTDQERIRRTLTQTSTRLVSMLNQCCRLRGIEVSFCPSIRSVVITEHTTVVLARAR